jgi:hypothetical protein
MTISYPYNPDLSQHRWHEESGFLHGHIHGVYYRMVCTREELEEVRVRESREEKRPITTDEAWLALDIQDYIDPWDEIYGEFEPASPFVEDLGVEARRKLIALNMYLNPDTTTWYGLGKQYALLMLLRRKDRRKALERRMLALGLDPEKERHPATRRRRALAFELGLNPYKATWTEIYNTGLELHKVVLPEALVWHADSYLDDKDMTFEELLQTALAFYLDSHANESDERREKRPVLNEGK